MVFKLFQTPTIMNTFRLLSNLYLLVLILLLSGCEKLTNEKNDPIDQSIPTLEVNVSPETVNQGGQAILVYKATGADELFLNGEILLNKRDTILLENLQINRDLIFLAKNKYGENILMKKITVIPNEPNTPSITTLVANPQTLPIGGGETVITWTSNQYTTLYVI